MALAETFMTTTNKEYKWPYPKPITSRPVQPPLVTPKSQDMLMAKPVEGFCHCDAHRYDPQMTRYKQLCDKEQMLCSELAGVNFQMTKLSNEILEHPCDNDDKKMASTFQDDYLKRGFKVIPYRPIRAAIDAPPGTVIAEKTLRLNYGYRDPTRFRYSAFERPTVSTTGPVTFATLPNTIEAWFRDNCARTEYQDMVSKEGLSILKNSQQYAEPLPSSRRRPGDQCL